MSQAFSIRPADAADIPILRELIDASVRRLQSGDYSPAQIDSALRTVFGVDTQLVNDRTYLLVEAVAAGSQKKPVIVACGGWSKRKTLYGGDRWRDRQDDMLDPKTDAAKIRAFFIHPIGLDKALAPYCWMPVNRRPARQASRALKWAPP